MVAPRCFGRYRATNSHKIKPKTIVTSAPHARPAIPTMLGISGRPDFIAETASGDRRYLILYYLDKRKAFACRTWEQVGSAIEFAGPYPMTEKETKLLKDLKDGSVSAANAGVIPGRLLVP